MPGRLFMFLILLKNVSVSGDMPVLLTNPWSVITSENNTICWVNRMTTWACAPCFQAKQILVPECSGRTVVGPQALKTHLWSGQIFCMTTRRSRGEGATPCTSTGPEAWPAGGTVCCTPVSSEGLWLSGGYQDSLSTQWIKISNWMWKVIVRCACDVFRALILRLG